MSNKDATTKILGFEYQKMIALIKCLEAKKQYSCPFRMLWRYIRWKNINRNKTF